MICFGLLDRDCRYIFISAVALGSGLQAEKFPGTYPWDWLEPDADKATLRQFYDNVYKWGEGGSIGTMWDNYQGFKRYYWTQVTWVDKGDITAVMHIWEFPPALADLTNRERAVLIELGNGNGTADVARTLGLSMNTVQAHAGNIKKKLLLESMSSLTAFATQYARIIGV